MTGELIASSPPNAAVEAVVAEINSLSTDELRRELATSLAGTATHLVRLAVIVRTLEERGEDLADLKIGLLSYLRRIAYGQILPEVVVRFAEYPSLVRRIAALPIPEQLRLAQGEPVPVAIRTEDGSIDHRLMDPLSLSGSQVAQVFSSDRIRTAAEQITAIETRRPRRRKKEGRVRVDRERGGLVFGRSFFPHGEILAALAELRSPQDDAADSDQHKPLVIQVGEEEHRQLKIRAAQSGCTVADLARRALRAGGLL